ncbi:MAG TPA: Vi polysaccharide biosynthesis UDP-N-acetylglucosamine C-6 dehydrogenase TviB, partial [Polyangiaceae bacterium]|nr:Vi polysaccharide biosynthesis UDP-N-acetylglucosamine C-6 dehydrogenase TviB [Polyangiaceae bacterium]
MPRLERPVVAVVGLGYVGRPLARAFARLYPTVGVDTSEATLQAARLEVPDGNFSSDFSIIAHADVIVVAVPTPISPNRQPDFSALRDSSTEIGRNMREGCTVVYESTVYPGATEEICVPLLEQASGLTWKRDFWVGYSPERINPG